MSLTKLERVKPRAKIAPHDMHITTEQFMIIIWQTSRFRIRQLSFAIVFINGAPANFTFVANIM